MQTGQVDAAINDIPVLLDFAKDNPDVEVTASSTPASSTASA